MRYLLILLLSCAANAESYDQQIRGTKGECSYTQKQRSKRILELKKDIHGHKQIVKRILQAKEEKERLALQNLLTGNNFVRDLDREEYALRKMKEFKVNSYCKIPKKEIK